MVNFENFYMGVHVKSSLNSKNDVVIMKNTVSSTICELLVLVKWNIITNKRTLGQLFHKIELNLCFDHDF